MRLKLLTESYRVEDGESWLKLVARVSAWSNHIIIMISIAKMNTINRTNLDCCTQDCYILKLSGNYIVHSVITLIIM